LIEPLAQRWPAVLESDATEALWTVEDFVSTAGKGGRPLLIEATNSPLGFRAQARPQDKIRAPNGRRLSARHRPSSHQAV